MNRLNIRELETYIHTPGLSLYATHATSLKNLLKKAALLTQETFPELNDALYAISHSVSFNDDYQTMILFINKYITWSYFLTQQLNDQLYVQKGLVTYPIEHMLYRIDRYWVLYIFHGIPQLFEGYSTHLIEAYHRYMTMDGETRLALDDTAGLVCPVMESQSWDKKCRYTSEADFIAAIDATMTHIIENDALPIVVIGDDESIAWFLTHSRVQHACVGTFTIQKRPSMTEMHDYAFPIASLWFKTQRNQVYKDLQNALRAHLCVQEIPRIWHHLHDDSVHLIAVDRTLHVDGCEDRMRSQIFLGTNCHNEEPIDTVDALLVTAHRRGIPVVLFEENELEAFQGIAAIVTAGQESIAS